jgi:ribosomal protein L9
MLKGKIKKKSIKKTRKYIGQLGLTRYTLNLHHEIIITL